MFCVLMKYDPSLYLNTIPPLPVFRIDRCGARLACPDQPARDYRQLLAPKLCQTASPQPIVVMIHGAGFSPQSRRANAQSTLYDDARYNDACADQRWSRRSWPMRLVNGPGQSDPLMTVGYGWHAINSAFLSKPNHRALFDAARSEAGYFAQFINALALMSGPRDINIIAHGLGARVVLCSLEQVSATAIQRIILTDAHEFNSHALTALASTGAQQTQFYNLRSQALKKTDQRANVEYPKSGPKDQLLALGFMFQRSNWVDLDVSSELMRSKLLRGRMPATAVEKICRWSFGGDRAVDDLIARILNAAPETKVRDLQAKLDSVAPAPKRKHSNLSARLIAHVSPLRRRGAV